MPCLRRTAPWLLNVPPRRVVAISARKDTRRAEDEPVLPPARRTSRPDPPFACAGSARGNTTDRRFNPKIGVFFTAFLPGFIPARASAVMLSLALGPWFIAETLGGSPP